VQTFGGSPVAFAHAIGLLQYPTLLAHVNYCDDAELDLLAGGQASVVYCPRTHRYFGHPPHRWRDMLRCGINVAVGTDSCASSPDLNLLAELRLLHEIDPQTPVELLWSMATTRAARAIGLAGQVGQLSPGAWADIIAVDTARPDVLSCVLDQGIAPRVVSIGGMFVGAGDS
jgi:aminodeoxyfutalosine deaminase